MILVDSVSVGIDSYKPTNSVPKSLADLYDPMFELFPHRGRVVVEIGSQFGWWAYRAARTLPNNVNIYCVDTWDGVKLHHPNMFEDWCFNLREFVGDNVFGLRGWSSEVAKEFIDPIDFLFLDGDHNRESVYKDLECWWPKIRDGGVIVGHDWKGKWGSRVQSAVKDFFGQSKINTDYLYWHWVHEKANLSCCWWKKKEGLE